MRNVCSFCTGQKCLPEAKLKSFALIAFVKQISEYPSVGCDMWVVVAMLMEINNEMEQTVQAKCTF